MPSTGDDVGDGRRRRRLRRRHESPLFGALLDVRAAGRECASRSRIALSYDRCSLASNVSRFAWLAVSSTALCGGLPELNLRRDRRLSTSSPKQPRVAARAVRSRQRHKLGLLHEL